MLHSTETVFKIKGEVQKMNKFLIPFLAFFILLGTSIPNILFSYSDEKRIEKDSKKTKILVGPNILVSRDGNFPHVELMVAMNPKDPKNFIGGAISFYRPSGGAGCKAYYSTDGGYIWDDVEFPEQLEFGGADPQVAFGINGTGYFAALAYNKGLHFYRSPDGGKTWDRPSLLIRCDHPQIIVDHSVGKFAGRIYIGVLYGKYPEYIIGIFRSDDDGKTFVGPVDCASGGGKIGMNVANMLIFSDGTLFVPYSDFEFNPEKRKETSLSTFWFVTSSDGGISFSLPSKIHQQYHKNRIEWVKDSKSGSFVRSTFPVYALDNLSKEYKDRLYVAWNDCRYSSSRILFSYSKDRGKSWSNPMRVSSKIPDGAGQYNPMMVVNNQGVIGIMWFGISNFEQQRQYDLYFSASIDGGESFLLPVKVTTEPSFPANVNNMKPVPNSVNSTEKSVNATLWSAFSWHAHGGDYLGLIADNDSFFRPFWADSRSETFQIWTTRINVNKEDEKGNPDEQMQNKKVKTSLNKKITLIFDPIKYDLEKQEALIPIRLKNISDEVIFGPFTVEVKSLIRENDVKYYGKEWIDVPQILNALNGKKGVGAVMDYSSVLGDFNLLKPSAITEAVKWKFKLPKFPIPPLVMYMEVDVKGFVLDKKQD